MQEITLYKGWVIYCGCNEDQETERGDAERVPAHKENGSHWRIKK